eukprot:jgi/Botrbrau1/23046/Bobra.136_1s0034.1
MRSLLQGLGSQFQSLSVLLPLRVLPRPISVVGRRETRGTRLAQVKSSASVSSAEDLLRTYGLTEDDLKVIEQKNPSALKSNVDKVLGPKVEYLRDGAHLSTQQLAQVLRAQPRILSSSLEDHIRPTVEYLRNIVGPSAPARLGRLLATRPVLLTYEVQENLDPKIKWLETLGIDRKKLPTILTRSPDILSIGIGTDLQPTVNFLKSVGLSDKEVADKIVRSPTLFHNHLSVLRDNVKTLLDAGLEPDAVKNVVLQSKQLFRKELSTASMQDKWKFADEHLSGVLPTLRACPHYFDHGLAKSIKPRTEYLKSKYKGDISFLSEILGWSTAEFQSHKRQNGV